MSELNLQDQLQQQKNDNSKFNAHRLFDAFSNINTKTKDDTEEFDDILIKEYLIAYEEIVKFLELLGSVFYFVIIDIKEKIVILEDFLAKNPENYYSVLSIVNHEKKFNYYTSQKDKVQYGARNILRLHRALIFIYTFLDQLFNADPRHKSAQICNEAYESTFAKYHSWIVRKAVILGVYTLPRRDVLKGYMCKTPDDLEKFPIFVRKVENVYAATQKIYEKYKILDLP